MDRITKLCAFAALLVLVIPAGYAQNLCAGQPGGSIYCDPPQTGVTPLGSYSGGPFDYVNNGNLNVGFTIPIFARPARGMSFSFALSYNSWIWYPTYSSTGNTMKWTPVSNWGWSVDTLPAGYYTYDQSQPGTCSSAPTATSGLSRSNHY